MDKLSMCIVAYRNYNDIIAAIDSIEKNTSSDISKKIYIVDNSSIKKDKTKSDTFEAELRKYSDISYQNTNCNLGFGGGHNYIINNLRSEYHAIVNPDIIFHEDAFSKIITYMDNNLDVGMVIPKIIDENGIRQNVYRKEVTVFDMFVRMFFRKFFSKRIREHCLQDMDYTRPFQVPFGQGSFLVIRTDLFRKLHGFDENFFMYLEDADLCKRVNEESVLMYYPYASVIHKWERGSHKNIKLFKYHLQSMNYYFKKWGIKWK